MNSLHVIRGLLRSWLGARVAPDSVSWLDDAAARIAANPAERDVHLSVSLVGRKIGKADLALGNADLEAAEAARPGWRPDDWSADQAARLYLVLSIPESERMATLVEQLCITADVAELVTFYRGLPLYPDPERYIPRAREGARSNMKAVFTAVAHHNPFPAEHFGEAAWNQMVLKALFIGAPLWPVERLDERANPTLSRILCDYAHERWAAGRPVSPELWRCVGRYADARALADLDRVLRTGTQPERRAAALALSDSALPAGEDLLKQDAVLTAEIGSGRLNWNEIRPA